MNERTKIRVALDTSALRAASLTSGPFEALARFAEAGYVQVFIPEVAVSEFNTLPSKKLEAKASLTATVKLLKKNLPAAKHEGIAELEAKTLKAFDEFEDSAKTNLKRWMDRANVTIVGVGADHGQAVVQKYFDGTPPFRAVKNRSDFPDGFVVEAILEVATDEVLVVVGDEGMMKALSDVANITLFESIAELLDSDEFDDLKSEVETDNVETILSLVRSSIIPFRTKFEEVLIGEIGGTTVRYHDPWDEQTDTLYVDVAGPVLDWHIDLAEQEYLGEGVISIPFNAVVEVSIDTSTGDYFHDDQYGISEDAEVAVEGTMSIIVDEPSLLREPMEWVAEELFANISVSIDEASKELKDFAPGSTKWSQYGEPD